MVAQPGQKELFRIGKATDDFLVDGSAKGSQGDIKFCLAGYSTGSAADTPPKINDKSPAGCFTPGSHGLAGGH
jgi:hypothetical protein